MHEQPSMGGGGALRQWLLVLVLAWWALLGGSAALAQTDPSNFNHDTTLFPLRGAHESVRCETCHVNGVFKGTLTQCSLCHVRGNRSGAVPMPANHIPLQAGQDCDLCHTSSTFTGVKFDHVTVLPGSCATCHNGYYAVGKTPGHPVTTQSCDACHTIGAFNAVAVPANHLPVGNAASQCGSCHTTSGANGIDYSQAALAPTHALTAGESCVSCHSSAAIAASRSAISAALTPKLPSAVNHIPVGSLDCANSGCHLNYAASPSFLIGAASISAPTLNVAGHAAVASAGQSACTTCHEAGTSFAGMLTSTAVTSDVRPAFDASHPATGDCQDCHTTAPTFFSNISSLPAGHVPTGSYSGNCAACHTTVGVYTAFDTVAVHTATGVACVACHNATTAGTALNQRVPIKLPVANHIPSGNADCASSGCHQNYTAAVRNFVIGVGAAGSVTAPTLTPAGHATVAAAGQTSCSTCHAAGVSYAGLQTGTTALSDVWPGGYDTLHPATSAGDCGSCHTTSPTFASNVNAAPPNHIPTGSFGGNCSACHANPGTWSSFDLVQTHQATGVACASCHNATTAALALAVAKPIKLTTNAPRAHIPVGSVDCGSSGCHGNYSTAVTSFVIGAGDGGNLGAPTLTTAGHASVAAATASCSTCHAAGTNYSGMQVSTTVISDVWPGGAGNYDPYHPATTAGDCSSCHSTAPTFGSNVNAALPSAHIPTGSFGSACASCHTTAGNYAVFDLVKTHQATGVGCLSCHNAATAALADAMAMPIKLQSAVNHIPIGSVECNSSGCHGNYVAAGNTFVIGAGAAGSVTAPTLGAGGHATAATAGVSTCSTCHGAGTSYAGMVSSTSLLATDVVPSASVDAYHAGYAGDCQTCHTTTPTFASNINALPTGHMPTGSAGVNCITCHTTAGAYNAANLVATHGTGLSCVSCHGINAGPYINAGAAIKTPADATNHIPFGSMDCGACHAAYAASGTASFVIGVGAAGSITAPTLNVSQHASAAAAGLTTCASCHNMNGSPVYTGMVASQAAGGDQFPSTTEDPLHQTYTGDCANCHSTTPTFRQNGSGAAKPAAHIPTGSAPACATCHTSGNFTSAPDIAQTHSSTGLACAQCHNSTVAGALAAATPPIGTVVIYDSSPGITHIPYGTLDCAICHGAYNGSAAVGSGSWVFANGGTAGNITNPSLTVALHSSVASQVGSCSSCHTSSVNGGTVYTGMVASTSSVVGDQFPNASLDAAHQNYTGDCAQCHTTAPTFHGNGVAQPNGHIPTTGAPGCTACHTTGVYTVHSPAAVHTATSLTCSGCHNATVAAAQAAARWTVTEPSVMTLATAANHIPVAALECASSGCHAAPTATSSTGFSGTFAIGTGAAGNINSPTLTAVGHTTILNQSPTPTCMTCHTGTSAGAGTLYTGMVASAAGIAGDTFPPSGLDPAHQSFSGTDCGVCHTTTPTFSSNHSATAGLPGNHIPLSTFPATPACSSCHLNAANYNVAHMNHSGLTGGCKTCHGVAGAALNFTNVSPTPEPPTHIPTSTGALGNACENCHRNAMTGNFQTFAGTVMDHTGISGSCAVCHAPGKSFYGVTIVTAPNAGTDGHSFAATLECSICHTNTQTPPPGSSTTGSAGGFASGTIVHSAVSGTPCYFCHEINGNPQYRTFSGTNINFRRATTTHYYPGGNNGGPDCVTGCHQHSTSDRAIGTGTTAEPGAILSPAAPPTLSSPAVGSAVSRIVTLTNPGGTTLAITSIGITGTGFTVTNGCGTALASLASCSITIQYLPTTAGKVTGTLTVTDNAGGVAGRTQTLAVTGVVATTTLTGANTPAGQSLSVVMLTSTGANVASLVQTVAFKNTGAAAITFTAETISGANAADFSFSSTGVATPCAVNGSVAAGATCNIGLVFTPKTTLTAEETALLTVTTTGLPGSYTAQLVGSISATSGNYAYAARQPARNGRAPTTLVPGRTGPTVVGAVPVPATGAATPGSKVQTLLGTPGALSAGGAQTGGPTVTTSAPPVTAPAAAGRAGVLAAPAAANPAIPPAAPLSGSVAAALGLQNGKLAPSQAGAKAAGGRFNHAAIVPGQCSTCHNGRAAPGLPPKHMLTTRSCDQCHTTIAWIPVNYQHLSPKYPRHAGNIACSACHSTNTEVVVPRFPQYQMTCAACHADRFVPQLHRHAENPQILYSVMDLKDCSGACHTSLGMRATNTPPRTGVHRSTAAQF